MIKTEKKVVMEMLELNPSFLIGKEIMLKNTDKDSVKIKDVNLKCTHILIEKPTSSLEWINVNNLEDEVLFNNFNNYNKRITINTILSMMEK